MDSVSKKISGDRGELENLLCAFSQEMREVVEEIRLYAPLDFPILIEGASGTGKEIVARAIHFLSGRSSSPFMPINLVEGADTLFESNLFGHRKGAFTGADHGRVGYIEMAKDGTIFMDEINSLPKTLQPKLLRVLEEKVYWPVGSGSPSRTEARFIFSSNQKLMNMLKEGRFREDVMYRLGRTIRLPLLKDRPEDIPCLAGRLVTESSHKIWAAFSRRNAIEESRRVSSQIPPELSPEALQKLRSYAWPGNVREMKTVLERAVLVCRNQIIQPDDIDFPYANERPFEEYQATLERFNGEYFARVIAMAGDNVRLGVMLTGLSETSYRRKVRKYRKRNQNGKT